MHQLSVEVDGKSFPTKPYMMNFEKDISLEGYGGLPDIFGKKCYLYGEFCVNRKDYADGHTIFGFDLTPRSTGFGPLTLAKQGNLSVSVVFNKAFLERIVIACMMIYDCILDITQHQQVIADFRT